jgi:hypothetical protein
VHACNHTQLPQLLVPQNAVYGHAWRLETYPSYPQHILCTIPSSRNPTNMLNAQGGSLYSAVEPDLAAALGMPLELIFTQGCRQLHRMVLTMMRKLQPRYQGA